MTRLLFSTMTLALFATACTAIVAGKLGDTGDYKRSDSTSTTSGTLDECSLLMVESQKNECSDCIETKCKSDVEYACQRDGKQKKEWFSSLASCAQGPYLGFESGYSYRCDDFESPGEPISGDDDAARRRNAELCVKNKCLVGATPPCALCPVKVQKTGIQEFAKLGESDCGKCLEENCKGEIVQCCGTNVVSEYVAKCSYTRDATNRAKCNELAGDFDPKDAGSATYETAEGKACQTTVRACFKQHCQERCANSR
jgi:hypothetical protein